MKIVKKNKPWPGAMLLWIKICGLLDYNNYVMWKTEWSVVTPASAVVLIINIDINNTDFFFLGGAAFV